MSAAKPLPQITSYPEPRYIRQLQGELFCLRANCPALHSLISLRTPEAPLGHFGALPSSVKTTGLLSPEQVRASHSNCLPQTALSFLDYHPQNRPAGICSFPYPPIDTTKKCNLLSKAKVWTKTPEANLVPHSSKHNRMPHSRTEGRGGSAVV